MALASSLGVAITGFALSLSVETSGVVLDSLWARAYSDLDLGTLEALESWCKFTLTVKTLALAFPSSFSVAITGLALSLSVPTRGLVF